MLKFYGIRFNPQAVPERYEVSIALRESLNASLHIHERFEGNLEKVIEAIDREINQLFQTSNNKQCKNRRFRFLLAKWFRTKDITNYLFGEANDRSIRTVVAKILNSPKPIDVKWQRLESIITRYIISFQPKTQDEMLHHPDSEIGLLFQMISLFFIEQDEEVPPVNLDLQFIRNQFPKAIWRKKDGVSAASHPFWLPKNPYCRIPFLLSRISAALHRTEIARLQLQVPATSDSIRDESPDPVTTAPVPLSLGALMPEQTPNEVRLMYSSSSKPIKESELFPETVPETLLSLQKTVQKQFSHEGVKHFLGILRQISECRTQNVCDFDTAKHFRLVARITRNGLCSDKQKKLFTQIFSLLTDLQVTRFWRKKPETKKITTSFIIQIGTEEFGSVNGFETKKLLLDPLFMPNQKNPYRLGSHLRLIPKRLFQESTHKHALLPGLSSYLCGCLLNEYPQKKGVVEKSAREIIDGCAFNIAATNRYRILNKLSSELAYMKQKRYIKSCHYFKNPEGNPWDDRYQITTSDEVERILTDLRHQATTPQIAELRYG